MDYTIILNQFNSLKKNLIYNIEQKLDKYKEETILFSKQFFHYDQVNTNFVYSIYGIKNNNLLYDSLIIEGSNLNLLSLPLEGLLFINQEVEFFENNKIIESSSQSDY